MNEKSKSVQNILSMVFLENVRQNTPRFYCLFTKIMYDFIERTFDGIQIRNSVSLPIKFQTSLTWISIIYLCSLDFRCYLFRKPIFRFKTWCLYCGVYVFIGTQWDCCVLYALQWSATNHIVYLDKTERPCEHKSVRIQRGKRIYFYKHYMDVVCVAVNVYCVVCCVSIAHGEREDGKWTSASFCYSPVIVWCAMCLSCNAKHRVRSPFIRCVSFFYLYLFMINCIYIHFVQPKFVFHRVILCETKTGNASNHFF